MSSLDETSDILSTSLRVINENENPEEKQSIVTSKDLDGIFTMLQSLNAKMDKLDDMDRRMMKLEEIFSKMENLEVRVKKTEMEISEAKREVKELQKSQRDIDTCLDGYGNFFDGFKEDLLELKSQTDCTKKAVTQAESSVADLKSEVECTRDELREDVLDLKCRSMRDNLLFYGIPEEDGEDCEESITELVSDKMKIRKVVRFERVHRVGRRRVGNHRGPPRPIVAKFSSYKDRDLVRKQAPRTLRGSNIWVQEQFPPEIEQRRKALYPVMKEERRKNNKVRLVRDRLYINGTEYIPPTASAETQTAHRTTPSQQDRKRPRTGSR
ncbi:hypothetical protein FSP39_007262 [Pinctada imbricata]|uniref:Uncharacterized protein n=1 Tax=Pinctada imbricata TaxID=66713 RepID=A0AA88YE65_PINIB|nr:hypothetical protein FSP39_007262 [Pinctada imbricata]